MTGIIDYGVGNLFSLCSSCKAIGEEAFVSGDASQLAKADRLILPGVGAFEDAARKLNDSGMAEFVRQQAASGKPLLGICLGMQLLFEKSYEYGCHEGLGLLKGQVVPMEGQLPETLKIPHMGWNDLTVLHPCALSADVQNGDYVYFVHSYRAETSDDYISCYTMYNEKIPALVFRDHVYGAQFHPEKSGQVGMAILKNFAKLVTA